MDFTIDMSDAPHRQSGQSREFGCFDSSCKRMLRGPPCRRTRRTRVVLVRPNIDVAISRHQRLHLIISFVASTDAILAKDKSPGPDRSRKRTGIRRLGCQRSRVHATNPATFRRLAEDASESQPGLCHLVDIPSGAIRSMRSCLGITKASS